MAEPRVLTRLKALEEKVGDDVGGVVMQAPTISGSDKIAPGMTLTYSISAKPGLANTSVSRFNCTFADQESVTVIASNNSGTVEITAPESAAAGDKFILTVVAIDSIGNKSIPATFTVTVSDTYIALPVFTSPIEGQTIDPVNITWELEPFAIVGDAEDTHAASRYRIVDESGAVVYDSGEQTLSTALTTWTAGTPNVSGGTHRLQAAFKGTLMGWSGWTNLTVDINGVRKPTLSTPSGTTLSHYQITFTTNAFALETSATTDTHTASQYRIRTQDGMTVLYDSGESADLVRHVIPDGFDYGLEVDKIYLADVRHKGAKYGWSEWSTTRTFGVKEYEQFKTEIALTTAGNYNFSVPKDVTQIRVLCIGGGGGCFARVSGDYGSSSSRNGGLGGSIVSALVNVVPGENIPITVGIQGKISSDSADRKGGDSSFGSYIIAAGTNYRTRGTSTVNLINGGTIICNLAESPCVGYKSCKSFEEMSLNKWTYDQTYESGGTGTHYSGTGTGSAGSAGSLHSSGYGIGGKGGAYGGAGGYGGGIGGTGGSGFYINSSGTSGVTGGKGGSSAAFGGSGGAGDNVTSGLDNKPSGGGTGGAGGTYGGCGGTGGAGGDWENSSSSSTWRRGGQGGTGGAAGYGGNGGNGGGYGSSKNKDGYNADYYGYDGQGQPGGKGCVIIYI